MTETEQQPRPGWRQTVRAVCHPRVLTLFLLGMAAGLPLMLIFSSLSLWLREAGVERSAITFFSWAALGYSFKFVWAPLVDRLPLPWLTRWLGRRRGWLLLAQMAIMLSILSMALVNPAEGPEAMLWMGISAVALGFTAATQDIVIDAYRIEVADARMQSLLAAAYTAGYRMAMIIAGAGAIWLAAELGSTAEHYEYGAWRLTYISMALVMLVGVMTTLLMPEPVVDRQIHYPFTGYDYGRFLLLFLCAVGVFITVFYISGDSLTRFKQGLGSPVWQLLVELLRLALAASGAYVTSRLLVRLGLVSQQMVEDTYIAPVRDFFSRYGLQTALLLLLLVGSYRLSDIVLGVISNVFYLDMGYSKQQIAAAVKTFGIFMVIAGGFCGGLLAIKYGVIRVLLLGAVLSAATNLLFVWLALQPVELFGLYLVVATDNLCAGLATAAFIAFLSSLTNISFTAMQYAIFSSLMTLLPKTLGGYSGTIVDALGYPWFFVLTAGMGVPVIWLICLAWRHLDLAQPASSGDEQEMAAKAAK